MLLEIKWNWKMNKMCLWNNNNKNDKNNKITKTFAKIKKKNKDYLKIKMTNTTHLLR